MSNPALMMAISGSLHYTPAAATLPSILQSAPGNGISASPSVTMGAAPTAGHYLVFTLYAAAAPSAVPAGFTEFTPCTLTSGGRYRAVYYRLVVAGDSATQSMTIASSTYWSAVMMEVKDVTSGLSSGVSAYNDTNVSSTVTIPAGVSGALPIVVNGASSVGFSRTWNTPAGFSLVQEVAYGIQVALSVFAGTAASTGAAVAASPVGYTSGSHTIQIASGFLIS
jgi:hypothetical protein